MKINDNGILRDMTPEEEKAVMAERESYSSPQLTEQEQIDALRQENEDLWLALAQVELGGEMV